jgi:diguanylate cyclase (GGDEF)-like protein
MPTIRTMSRTARRGGRPVFGTLPKGDPRATPPLSAPHPAPPSGGGRERLRSFLWQPPDPQALEIGREGEVLIAKVRLWAVGVSSLIPLSNLFLHPPQAPDAADIEPWIGVGAAVVLLALGAFVLTLAKRAAPRWLGLFSSLLDVSILSLANAAFILAGHPLAATNGRIFFSLYLLAMASTCLRQDARLCLLSGLAAMLQYGAIVLWAVHHLGDPGAASSTYGTFRWDNQVARLIILAVATGINGVIVQQAQSYLSASLHDPLTRLPNRRYAEHRLEQALAMARRTGRTGVLALADLDRFKQVNDRHGHAAGDEALRQTADFLRHFFRATDIVARYGGEEFLILFPEAEIGPAMERLRQFQAAFSREPVQLPGGRRLALTLSMGVAAFPADGQLVADLIERADQRLYAAKQAGRNRVA